VMKLLEIKAGLRQGIRWPGGYPIYFWPKMAQALSDRSVRENWREIVSAHLTVEKCPVHVAIRPVAPRRGRHQLGGNELRCTTATAH